MAVPSVCVCACVCRPLLPPSGTAAFVRPAFLPTLLLLLLLRDSSWFLQLDVTAAAKRSVKQVQSCPDTGGG